MRYPFHGRYLVRPLNFSGDMPYFSAGYLTINWGPLHQNLVGARGIARERDGKLGVALNVSAVLSLYFIFGRTYPAVPLLLCFTLTLLCP